ncbi:hypothetical protein F5X68DRAFT_229853 [Plectosphaerella plurivora]|uniref:Uncharacterized protein n=1 Tax=Plectosphaerella plurivora TaxID=936078 RepID=A0A9P8VHN3_9PEZI|nr:hypothetical protein F5X68DRAFT_229853 [Plectosphaerella plurivora]
MCLAENCYFPACGCWVGHEVISPCIRRHGGTGGVCRELVVEGVLRKSGICLPCERKQRPQLSDMGRNLSSFMSEIHESSRASNLQISSQRRASIDSASTTTTEETLVNSEYSRQDNDGWTMYAMRVQPSFGSEDSLLLLPGDENDTQAPENDEVNSALTLSRYLQLYHPESSWYHVAAAPPSPLESEPETWEMELDSLLAAEERDRIGQAAPAARSDVRRNKNRCCGCIPS